MSHMHYFYVFARTRCAFPLRAHFLYSRVPAKACSRKLGFRKSHNPGPMALCPGDSNLAPERCSYSRNRSTIKTMTARSKRVPKIGAAFSRSLGLTPTPPPYRYSLKWSLPASPPTIERADKPQAPPIRRGGQARHVLPLPQAASSASAVGRPSFDFDRVVPQVCA